VLVVRFGSLDFPSLRYKIDTIRSGKKSAESAPWGCQLQLVLDAVVESAATGRRVTIEN
jgi:hypothetical protein